MSDELKDILSNLNHDIEQDKLLEYLNRRLSNEEQYLLEREMSSDDFMSDAIEGLEQIKDKEKVSLTISQLNAGLRKQLGRVKKKKQKETVLHNSWIYYTIILLLLLAVLGYVVITKLMI